MGAQAQSRTQTIVSLIVRAKELNAPLEVVLDACGSYYACIEIALDVYNIRNIGDKNDHRS
jgi:hypothetical protein